METDIVSIFVAPLLVTSRYINMYMNTCNIKYMELQAPPNCHQYVPLIRKELSRNINFSPLRAEVLKHV